MNPTPAKLSCWLRKLLQQGLRLDDAVQAYMTSTFGTTDLDVILAEAQSSEIDSLTELLLYPDTDLQARYEQQWGDTVFNKNDRQQVIACLQEEPITAALYLLDQNEPVAFNVPAFALAEFVHRLNITWQPPRALDQTLADTMSEDQRIAVRVRLRNTRLEWSKERIDLLILFFKKIRATDQEFYAELDFLLGLLWELRPATHPYDFLIEKKRQLFMALCKADAFERRRLAGNMEIIMLQGERAAFGDIHELKHQMHRIDAICNALFGRTQFFTQPGEHHITVDGGPQNHVMSTVLKILS